MSVTSCYGLLLLICLSLRQPSTHISPRLSRKISRNFITPPRTDIQPISETTGENGAGPSESNQAQWTEEANQVPTSPSTEYPDQFEGLPLPSYYHNAETDPIALVSLEHGPPINGASDYTEPPPPELSDEPAMDEPQSGSFTGSGYTELPYLSEGTFMSK